MRSILITLFLTISLLSQATKYYIAPTGSDGNSGTLNSPYFHLDKAWSSCSTNDTIYAKAGTYLFTSQQDCRDKNGIKILPYTTRPVFSRAAGGYFKAGLQWNNGAAKSLLIFMNCDNLTLKGFDVTGFTQDTTGVCSGIKMIDVSYLLCENVRVYGCGQGMNIVGAWLSLNDTSVACRQNIIRNCDFFDNTDPLDNYNNGSGLSVGVSNYQSTTYIAGCRFWNNVDNGMDTWNQEGTVYMTECWSFHNGYLPHTFTKNPGLGNGVAFKLGQTLGTHTNRFRIVTNCIAFDNTHHGFDQNTMKGPVVCYNCVSISNGGYGLDAIGFNFYDGNYYNILINNISYQDDHTSNYQSNSTVNHNSWNSGYTVTSADFVTMTDTAQLSASRQADGSLPYITFLRLAAGSDLINTGADVKIAYLGSAPDLGAFEYLPTKATGTVVDKKKKVTKGKHIR